LDAQRRAIWVADAHRIGKLSSVARADEKLEAFMELESTIRAGQMVRTKISLKAGNVRYAFRVRLHTTKVLGEFCWKDQESSPIDTRLAAVILSALSMLNPQIYPHSGAQIAAKSSATCDGQISYENDESNKQNENTNSVYETNRRS